MMKIVYLFFCFVSLLSSDCNQSPSAKSTSNQSIAVAAENTEMKENSTFQKRLGDLEYTVTTRLVKKGLHDGINYENDYLYIDYKVRNSGSKNYLVFNRGHDDRDEKNLVYVEPQADGSIEISQKAFVEPSRKVCPARDAPIMPRASWYYDEANY